MRQTIGLVIGFIPMVIGLIGGIIQWRENKKD